MNTRMIKVMDPKHWIWKEEQAGGVWVAVKGDLGFWGLNKIQDQELQA